MKTSFPFKGKNSCLLLAFFLLSAGSAFSQTPNFAWASQAQGTYSNNNEKINAVATDADGNTYATGSFEGTVTLGSTTFTSAGRGDILIAKYDSAGNVLWARRLGGPGDDMGSTIAVDNAGNYYITGRFAMSITLGSTVLTTGATVTSGDIAHFIAKFDQAGNAIWGIKPPEGHSEMILPMAIDYAGNCYITGEFQGSMAFGSTTISSPNHKDAFIAKYSSAGVFLWAKKGGSTNFDDEAIAIATDSAGNSYITGTNEFTATFSTATISGGGHFIVKYDPAGNVVWARKTARPGVKVSLDNAGNSYITGDFESSALFGGGYTLYSTGYVDVFIAKYDATGTIAWAKKGGGAQGDYGLNISTDAAGNSYISGRNDATATFGGFTVTGAGGYLAKYNTSGDVLWAKKVAKYASTLGIDASGNSYLAGSFYGTAVFGNTTLTSGVSYPDMFVAKFNNAGNNAWANQPIAVTSANYGRDIARDNQGNLFVTGTFFGTITIGSTTLTSQGPDDIFVAKYNASGVPLWAKKGVAKRYQNDEMVKGIGVDNAGNCYITGDFRDTAVFDNITLLSVDFNDIYITKYDASGNVVWAKRAGGVDIDRSNNIVVDGAGNSYITGKTAQSPSFDNITLPFTYNQFFIAKYDALGNAVWVQSAEGTMEGFGISTDNTGNVFVAGTYDGPLTIGSVTLPGSLNSGDGFIAKYSAAGALEWAKRSGFSSGFYCNGIAVDNAGNSYITGSFSDFGTFGTTNLTVYGPGTARDIYVAKYNTSGTCLWANKAGTSRTDESFDIAVDINGSCYVTGRYSHDNGYYYGSPNATFGTTTLTSNGAADAFIAKYTTSGSVLWVQKIGSTSTDTGYGIVVDEMGNSYVTGAFYGSAMAGSTTLASLGQDMFVAKIHYSSNPTSIATGLIQPVNFCQGSAVSVPFTASGTYNPGNIFTAQLSNAQGSFVSPVTIGTLSATTSGTINAVLPAAALAGTGYRIRVISSLPINGTTTDNGANLTINGIYTTTTTPVICPGSSAVLSATGAASYSWAAGNGLASQTGAAVTATPTTNGVHTYTVSGISNGCSSTATISVTVEPTVVSAIAGANAICTGQSTTLFASGASTYTWSNGQTGSDINVSPTTTTTYTVTGEATPGCSNTATITITVNPLPTVTLSASSPSICLGQGATLTASGANITYYWSTSETTDIIFVNPPANQLYTVTGMSPQGCTATASIILNVNANPVVSAINNTVCAGSNSMLSASGSAASYSWSGPGNFTAAGQNILITNTTTAMTGIYTVTGTSAQGCATTATSILTVNPAPNVVATAQFPTLCASAWTGTSLYATGADSYSWSTGNYGNSISVFPPVTTTYTVVGTALGCSSTAQVTVTVNQYPTISLTTSQASVCAGQSVNITAAGATTYSWNTNQTSPIITVSPSVTTNYSVTGANANCAQTSFVTITVNQPPALSATDVMVCEGSPVTLNLTGPATATYTWAGPGGFTSSAQNPTISSALAGVNTYLVTATQNGCSATETVTVTGNAVPQVMAAAAPDSLAPGDLLTLFVSNPLPGNTYQWFGPDLNQSSGDTVTATPTGNGDITYTLVATYGPCSSTATVTVHVDPSFLIQTNGWNWAISGGGINGIVQPGSTPNNPELLITGGETGIDIASSATGETTTLGRFKGSTTFGATTLSSSGSEDMVVLRTNAAGTILWAKRAGSAATEQAKAISIDMQGNSYITGSFSGTADFGSYNLASTGTESAFLARYDAAGTVNWAVKSGGNDATTATDIVTDAQGNSTITGLFNGTANFGPHSLSSAGGSDIFVARFDATGNAVWAKKFGGTEEDGGYAVTIDNAGSSYLTGTFQGTITFGATSLTSLANYSKFLVKLDNMGNVLWAKLTGTAAGADDAEKIATNNTQLYTTGVFTGTTTFGTTTLSSHGSTDIYLAAYNLNGNISWACRAGGPGEDISTGITTDTDGLVYITGSYNGSTGFGSHHLSAIGNEDVFVAKYDNAGNALWARKAGGIYNDAGASIATDAQKNCYLTGYFTGRAAFGSEELFSNGQQDMFVARLSNILSAGNEEITNGSGLLVYPNPFRSSFSFKFISVAEKADIVLTDVLGRQVFSKTYPTQTGETTLHIQPEVQLLQGVYLLQIKQNNQTQTIRIVKQ